MPAVIAAGNVPVVENTTGVPTVNAVPPVNVPLTEVVVAVNVTVVENAVFID